MPVPMVVSVTEQNTIGPDRKLVKAVVLRYTVDGDGPFTLVTTQADIASGVAKAAMQTFANSLANLPRG